MHFNQAHKDETMVALMLFEVQTLEVVVVAADTVLVVVDIDQIEPRC
jgi:hypothetical protein